MDAICVRQCWNAAVREHQMIAAIRSNGRTAWHLLGTDEGHGFAKKANQDYQFWANLLFWRETLLSE